MAEPTVVAALLGALVGAALALLGVLLRSYARGSRQLGTDAEHARHRTLHLAASAAGHLRDGLAGAGAPRAARELRALLGCEALALVDHSGEIVQDAAGGRPAEQEALRAVARDASETGRTVIRALGDGRSPQLVAVPLSAGTQAAGALVAVAQEARAPLVRASGEVAAWVSAQLGLAELEHSRAALAESELRALRAQISPHFIYNALNAIASTITRDPAAARELVLEFADFTRYSFRRQGEYTTLAEELRSIHAYLQLERARFGDRLQVTLRIAPETLSTVIPFLSLQPLVENAVRHGLEAQERGGRITVTAEEAGSLVRIAVEDDGAGSDPAVLERVLAGAGEGDGEHVGLRNVDRRLRRSYGARHGLVVDTGPGAGTLVRLEVPRSQPGHEALA
ncbi:sensor histidine kinase [Homoserinibacter sp. YIM 151385]|uniref:sensor histidine kinase n=1 Tax=Homoserinibacter sp. YIM 151385 TaxID=2985506 RepID=UPI0022F01E37|nr:histidine kinase [Homoserinibacter sp. YIM 151385]WBU38507.1 histidine kinase [Homoserinibacter sp. YIM 151385]